MTDTPSQKPVSFFATGILFSILWASAAAATKIGLHTAQPFVICVFRFLIAGSIMLFITHVLLKNKLPQGKQWLQIFIYSLLNISLYLGLYVLGMQHISAGLGALAPTANPVLISVLSVFFLGQRFTFRIFGSLVLCMLGVIVAAYPLLQRSMATWEGIIIILLSMLSYSGGSIYFSRKQWEGLHLLTINGWQTIMGCVTLLPVMLFTYNPALNHYNASFWGSILWLAIPVSIAAVQLWLLLLRQDAVKASYWLFLCPVAGFVIAAAVMREPLTMWTLYGVILVLTGLYIIQRKKSS
ncbi:MAG TPA: EamA family transporter [Chitinophaga sp.]|uniref:DMT family transporter n=1 Tax=Chitinophaga sp. TaxID=1869181 RepID=UPI002C4905CC|nr:EamA family transporter [Chitinophaga sp.]HVI45926.1 EamA family transporter [Chitinophaga sp.]